MIDKNGKIFGKVSIIDILIIVAILAVGIGFVYRNVAPQFSYIINPNDVFYVTIESNRLRGFNKDAIEVGDLMFRLHGTHPLGRVVDIFYGPAMEIIRRTDGLADLVQMEERYQIFITLESTGNIRATGYFVNGNDHIAPGSEIILVSNRVHLPLTTVYSIRER